MDNFQPIPKRFMVWDTKYEKFLTVPMEIWQIVIHFRNRYHQLYDDSGNSRYVFCQSTNLFDKDRKEIFEGSIVENEYLGTRALCFWDEPNAEFDFNPIKGHDNIKGFLEEYKVIGHIFSNPELLEV